MTFYAKSRIMKVYFERNGVLQMDIEKLLGQLLSSDALKGLSKASGASKTDVKKVISEVLPDLLSGAEKQAKSADTAEGFTKALSDHAKVDTSDIKSFLKNIDLADGAKIIGHLLGKNTSSTTKAVSQKTGVTSEKTGNILASLAPLLMSLLGKQTGSDDSSSDIGDLMGSLLGSVDVADLLGGLLGSSSKKTTKKTSSTQGNLTNVLGSLLKGLFKK